MPGIIAGVIVATFIPAVERWRGNVAAAVKSVLMTDPAAAAVANQKSYSVEVLTDVLLAIIQKESSGNPAAVGDSGRSVGLMQLNFSAGAPQDAGYMGTREGLLDPSVNILYGVRFFFQKLVKYGNVPEAILAYNAGSLRYTAAGLPINQEYLQAVLNFLGEKKTSFFPLEQSPPLRSLDGFSSNGPQGGSGGVSCWLIFAGFSILLVISVALFLLSNQ